MSIQLSSLLILLLPATAIAQEPAARNQIAEMTERLTEAEAQAGEPAAVQLIAIDTQLREMKSSGVDPLRDRTLVALGRNGTRKAREHLRSAFESDTPRRHTIAYAISLAAHDRPNSDRDWQYLVRSLTVVEGRHAVSVLTTLRRFRRRANKASWLREVMLIATRLPEEERQPAYALLAHWSGHSIPANTDKQLHAWQSWYRDTFPGAPPPEWPVDSARAKWPWAKLSPQVDHLPAGPDAVQKGQAVYARAGCIKCHRRGELQGQPENNRLGPDLTSLGWRRQNREVLSAILYPSHRLDEDYPVTTVILTDGRSVTGLLMRGDKDELRVAHADGTETRFPQSDLEASKPTGTSNMPAGTLDNLSLEEIRYLMAFLCQRNSTPDPHARLGR